jgi:hypothetical protein
MMRRVSEAPKLTAAIIAGGLAAGALDLLYAFVLIAIDHRPLIRVLHSIASGALGASAYDGGMTTAILGFMFHFGITVAAAAVYFFIARTFAFVREHFWICGAIFGALVYLFMNFVVLPLSAVPFEITYTPAVIVQGLVSHAVLVGLPIAFFLHKLYFSRRAS